MSLRATALATVAAGALAGHASADLFINEVLGSTSGSDLEFIEIYNSGAAPVDLTGFSIALYDSDSGTSFGGTDGGSPYALSGIVPAGGFLAFGNVLAAGTFGAGAFLGGALPANAIENSSYTIILEDASGTNFDAIFVTDGGAGDIANEAGAPVAAEVAGPDGTFLPAGIFRTTDGGGTFGFLEFGASSLGFSSDPGTGTPGISNVIPEPASMALLGLGGLMAARRRRTA